MSQDLSNLQIFLEGCSRNQLIIYRLLDQGLVDINDADPVYKWTGLHLAARNGHVKVCQELIKRGANLDAVDAMGQTPLHRASFWDHTQVVQLLIDSGADFTIMDDMMQTAFELAAQGHSSKAMELLKHAYFQLESQPNTLKLAHEKVFVPWHRLHPN